jgi:hypothetical protein
VYDWHNLLDNLANHFHSCLNKGNHLRNLLVTDDFDYLFNDLGHQH